MNHAEDFDRAVLNTVGDEEGRSGNHKFACVGQFAGATAGWECRQLFGRTQYSICCFGCGARILFGDELPQMPQVAPSSWRPEYPHDPGFTVASFPQVCNSDLISS